VPAWAWIAAVYIAGLALAGAVVGVRAIAGGSPAFSRAHVVIELATGVLTLAFWVHDRQAPNAPWWTPVLLPVAASFLYEAGRSAWYARLTVPPLWYVALRAVPLLWVLVTFFRTARRMTAEAGTVHVRRRGRSRA
jgi:hypothetical protein